MTNDYDKFLISKTRKVIPSGFESGELNSKLYDWQQAIVKWALLQGKAALFEDCGLGKTAQQLEWGRCVSEHTNGPILILAPLAVSYQTKREGKKFNIKVNICKDQSDVKDGINITNYERIEKFELDSFAGVVLDESSIIKNFSGKMRKIIINGFQNTKYKLACTATPSPNDYMELGNHAEFLDVIKYNEMLSMFFVHDGGQTSKWRLKGHAESQFWKWMCEWAIMIQKPEDIGYTDLRFTLPPVKFHQHLIKCAPTEGMLLAKPASTLKERRQAKRNSIEDRAQIAADLANNSKDCWLIWCELNDESSALNEKIPDAVEVRGSDPEKHKKAAMLGFSKGTVRVLITKPSIAGFGMNWQHCNNMIFVGLSDSYEKFYQAQRRCWRYGQKKTVNCHIVSAETESRIIQNIKRKEKDAKKMLRGMVENMSALNKNKIKTKKETKKMNGKNQKHRAGDGWDLYMGDCVTIIKSLERDSIHLSVFSPPFASLYTYSDKIEDMGNTKNDEEFMTHFKFIIPELFRITKPGRICAVHCMDLPSTIQHNGYIGLRDFPGEIIRAFTDSGWIWHSKTTIWKDPVTAMQRTKAIGLLHKQLKKDSCMSRMGIPDYVLFFRKPGDNPEKVSHTNDNFPVKKWQEWASPIWMDIQSSKTLQKTSARENKDEKHICPLQLDVIERCVLLYSNPGDLVFSPFAGIGSEGFVSLLLHRKFVGVELKKSYWRQACRNLKRASLQKDDKGLLE